MVVEQEGVSSDVPLSRSTPEGSGTMKQPSFSDMVVRKYSHAKEACPHVRCEVLVEERITIDTEQTNNEEVRDEESEDLYGPWM
ncbi:hypothetical protein V6N13_019918 [Hibiscus sabdariffa]